MKLQLTCALLLGLAVAHAADTVDQLILGNVESEQAHHFEGLNTKPVIAALGEPARISLPKEPVDYYGGDLTFDLKVDPVRQNYFTVKFWGSDVNGGQKALLYINGEQLGYRHLGDYEALNHGAGEPSFQNRFFYYTTVLPLNFTRERNRITLTIRTIGPISGYSLGGGYDGYQGKMRRESRGYYRVYTHTTPALAGLEGEKQGAVPPPPPVRFALSEPRPGNLDVRAADRFAQQLNATGTMPPNDIADFARLAAQLWSTLGEATRQKAITQLVAKIDAQSANAYDPNFFAKGIYQGDWGGSFAPVAEAIFYMNKFVPLKSWQPLLGETITVKDEAQTRRQAWTRMIKGNFDYARTHIAHISNQAMFCLHGAYRSNRALQIINPAVAEPEETGKRFLFEAAGIWPFRGNDILDANGRLIGHEDPFGDHYFVITDKGLTREFTYVAIYGEAANDLVRYYELYGYDEILKKGLLSVSARAQMKYSDLDEQGFRGMRMEGVIESRGPAYPDDVGYVQRRRGLTMLHLVRLMTERREKYQGAEWRPYWKIANDVIGYAQQMLGDNQPPEVGGSEGLADYLFIKNHPPTGVLLPNTMLSGYRPDEVEKLKAAGLDSAALEQHAWADEDDGTIALRDGDLTMFVGLVMKANWGVNGIARVHCITPTLDRLATVVPDVQFEWSGKWSVRPDWVNVQFMNANNPPEGTFQALAGEVLPFASQPNVRPAVEPDNPYCGYANFYTLRYLKYLIGMNTTRAAYGNARSYALKLPAGFRGDRVFDFITKTELPVKDGAVEVGPQSTVVLRMADDADPSPLPMASRLSAAFSGDNGVTVRWLHAPGATSYIVKRSGAPGDPWIEAGRVDGKLNLFVDSTMKTNDRSVRYTVTGVNKNGAGLDAPTTAIMPPNTALRLWFDQQPPDPSALPTAVRELHGENIKRQVSLAWKVARRGQTYDVLRAAKAEGPFVTVAKGLTRTEWMDQGVEFGQSYCYTVMAVNHDGLSGPKCGPVSFSPMDDTIPKPWQGVDIGNVGAAGSEGLASGVFSVRGSGGDVWAGSDEFRFVYQPLEGDGTIIARIRSQQDTSSWTKSGIMFRESLGPDAKNVFVFQTPGEGLYFQSRTSAGTTMQTKASANFPRNPWLKLTRHGDVVTAFASAGGGIWTKVGSATMVLPKTLHAGLVVNSHSRGAINLTEFDQVEFQ
jgi:hypothetical protein